VLRYFINLAGSELPLMTPESLVSKVLENAEGALIMRSIPIPERHVKERFGKAKLPSE
jgi:hypothetical protein